VEEPGLLWKTPGLDFKARFFEKTCLEKTNHCQAKMPGIQTAGFPYFPGI